MQPRPTLRQLQFFAALARRKSFSKAAADCFVSQSTLSSAIKELEGMLGAQLVDRSTRAFALTPAGEDAAARAAPILAMAEDLARSTAARRPLEGSLHLGVIPTIAPFLLPKTAPRLKKRYPKLELFLREDLTAPLVERLHGGLLDAAVLALPYDLRGAEAIEIGEDPFWFAAGPQHPVAQKKKIEISDLEGAGLMLLEDGHCLREHAMEACRLQSGDFAQAFGATSLFTLAQMVRSGLGATLLPNMAVQAGFARANGLEAVPFAPPAPSRRVGLAFRKGSGRRKEAEAIAEVLREALASFRPDTPKAERPVRRRTAA
jgi:LysR family hydrogen peroxide-inducible transcriptional activator